MNSGGDAGSSAGSGAGGAGGTAGGSAGAAGAASATGALHVNGRFMVDGNGERVVPRGPELVIRWGVYAGLTPQGVDVPWEGGSNNNVGSATIRELAKTNANSIRIYGGIGNELDALLHTLVVEQHLFVGVGRVDWTNAQMKATLQKYAKYIFLHPRGEFTHRDASLWRTEALNVVRVIRDLGYTSPIEIGTTGYGQTWSTLQMHGQEVAASDPLKNTLFLLQLYSELATAIPQTLNSVVAFPYPVNVGSCLFTSTYGNTPNTYKEVWDQTYAKEIGSYYWDWWGDGEGNSMTTNGLFTGLNAIGQYIVNDSPAALKNTTKTAFLMNAAVP